MGFFGDAEKSTAIIFPEFDEEVFSLNLKFTCCNDVFHTLGGPN